MNNEQEGIKALVVEAACPTIMSRPQLIQALSRLRSCRSLMRDDVVTSKRSAPAHVELSAAKREARIRAYQGFF